jgi:hypothetical protein
MEDANLQRPLVPVPLTLELIRATFQPLRNRDFVVPLNECISEQSFERIEGEGMGDCCPIGIQNCINIQEGKQTQHTFEYHSVLKPLKQQACDIMMQYVLDCSEEDLKKIKGKTPFARGIVHLITCIIARIFLFFTILLLMHRCNALSKE